MQYIHTYIVVLVCTKFIYNKSSKENVEKLLADLLIG